MNLSPRFIKKDSSIPPTEFVGGFPRKGISIVASKPGTGKTWFVLYSIITLAKHNIKSCAFFGDCPPNVIYDRINSMYLPQDILTEEKQKLMQMYFLTDALKDKKSIILTTEEGMHNFAEVLHYERPEIVFIDTFTSLTTIEENSQKDTSLIFSKLMTLAEKYNCAIIILHHLRKSGRKEREMSSELDDVIGSSIITRLASVVIILEKRNENSVILRTVKTWYDPEEQPIQGFSITTRDDNGLIEIVPSIVRARADTSQLAIVKDWLDTLEKGTMFTYSTVSMNCKMSMTSARTQINSLIDSGSELISVAQNSNGNTKKVFVKETDKLTQEELNARIDEILAKEGY